MAAARVISNGDCGGACLFGIFPVNNIESGLTGLEDYKGRLRFGCKGYLLHIGYLVLLFLKYIFLHYDLSK